MKTVSQMDPLGGQLAPVRAQVEASSTDMSNVSRIVRSLHASICLERGAELHTSRVEAVACSADGDRAVVDGAVVLSSVLSVRLSEPRLFDDARAAFGLAS